MADYKMTLNEYYATVKAIAENVGTQIDGLTDEMVAEMIRISDEKVAQANAKKTRDAEKRAEKKAAGDALRAKVLEFITDEFQTGDEIAVAMQAEGIEDATPGKVRTRLSDLVANGDIVKEKCKDKGNKMAYRLPGADEDAE